MDNDKNKIRQISLKKRNDSDSETSGDENDAMENGMTFIRHRRDSKIENDCTNIIDEHCISSLHQSSDSENEDGAMEKLSFLITGYIISNIYNEL